MHREQFGTDYRLSTEGEHPVERLREQHSGTQGGEELTP